jgi:uncharacterized protein YjiS (DUF1127 family)
LKQLKQFTALHDMKLKNGSWIKGMQRSFETRGGCGPKQKNGVKTMSRITSFDTLPAFGAAAVQGPALAASFPFARPSLSQHRAVRFLKRLIARLQAARLAQRNARELAAMSESALRDIGLNRSNTISAATEVGLPAFRADTNE